MNCNEARCLLAGVLGGSLEGESARQVRTHLADCPACAGVLVASDRVEALVAKDEIVTPSEGLQERFRARLQAHRQQTQAMERLAPLWSRMRSWTLPQRLAAAVALSAMAAAAIYLNTGSPDMTEAPQAEVAVAQSLPLLQDMEIIENLELLENFEVIEGLSDAAASPH
jgi:anti-sigma-K factor RskA